MSKICHLFDIQRGSFVDGPGIRTTVFFKGCNLRCQWCHNPESWSQKSQLLFYTQKCTACGACRSVCPQGCPEDRTQCISCGSCAAICPNGARELCGFDLATDELMEIISKDAPFYRKSGGGVTFSGGECMLQVDALEEVLKLCVDQGIPTAVDTAGNVPWESFERVLPYTDLFLYDVKLANAEKHRHYTGTDNERILENLHRLSKNHARIWIRIPIIRGVNDTIQEMDAITSRLEGIAIEKVELLPYHKLGQSKFKAMDMTGQCFEAPDKETLNALKQRIAKKVGH